MPDFLLSLSVRSVVLVGGGLFKPGFLLGVSVCSAVLVGGGQSAPVGQKGRPREKKQDPLSRGMTSVNKNRK